MTTICPWNREKYISRWCVNSEATFASVVASLVACIFSPACAGVFCTGSILFSLYNINSQPSSGIVFSLYNMNSLQPSFSVSSIMLSFRDPDVTWSYFRFSRLFPSPVLCWASVIQTSHGRIFASAVLFRLQYYDERPWSRRRMVVFSLQPSFSVSSIMMSVRDPDVAWSYFRFSRLFPSPVLCWASVIQTSHGRIFASAVFFRLQYYAELPWSRRRMVVFSLQPSFSVSSIMMSFRDPDVAWSYFRFSRLFPSPVLWWASVIQTSHGRIF